MERPVPSIDDPQSPPRAAPMGPPRSEQLLELVSTRGYERREEPFQLSSGGFSHDYVDLRRAVARGSDLELAATAVLAVLGSALISFEAIGGMTMGADPVAHAVALVSGLEWFSVRKSQKGHGRGQRIEGAAIGPGRPVVLFEDTVSTGASIFEAYEVIAETGAEVVAACTLLDRGELAARRFAALGVTYLPLLTYRDLCIDPIES
jgi:orotate phosphoribosyltransferase